MPGRFPRGRVYGTPEEREPRLRGGGGGDFVVSQCRQRRPGRVGRREGRMERAAERP